MTGHPEQADGVTAALAFVGVSEPDRARSALVLGRCLATLERQRRREMVRGEPGWRFAVGLTLGPVVVGTLCAVYLFEVLSRALSLYRF